MRVGIVVVVFVFVVVVDTDMSVVSNPCLLHRWYKKDHSNYIAS